MRHFSIALIAGAALALAGCGDDDGPEDCDLTAPDCPADQVCLANDEGGPSCEAACDPEDPAACGDGLACDRVETGLAACFEPVLLRGLVFDLTDDTPIEGARVLAADHTGIAVTDVAVTGADGRYELRVPVTRDATGDLVLGTFTLRVVAQDYQPYPFGIRPAIPIDGTTASYGDGVWVLDNVTTEVALIPLPAELQGLGSISGAVIAERPGGTLVVAECAEEPPCPLAFADLSGNYVIYNVPDAAYSVRGYQAGLQLEPEDVTVSGGAHLTGIDLAVADRPLATISGSVNVVNPGDGSLTSVVLIPESAFLQLSETFLRGEVPPGLRDPAPGVAPDVSGAFTITGVPEGTYVVLAAFENDFLVRDPDPNIAGTQIVHQTVPDGTDGVAITLDTAFKVTGALTLIGPGADGPEAVDPEALVFKWEDDSSEDFYRLVLYDAFGNLVWEVPDVPRVTGGGNVEVTYDGTALEPGMYYQWRAVSHRTAGPISTTEDLLGVFYVPGTVN